ncbi:6361_t:CDS:10 [Paraglomus brasilianum]|uniref:6361_t:CDS:1 n=1 Tax=Paraglomus brasilianum TaxID=144538 RepID=A0A9N9G4V9_9GLOM|nr:6361_t:CDS:10 [Paraglomus brasilianum]
MAPQHSVKTISPRIATVAAQCLSQHIALARSKVADKQITLNKQIVAKPRSDINLPDTTNKHPQYLQTDNKTTVTDLAPGNPSIIEKALGAARDAQVAFLSESSIPRYVWNGEGECTPLLAPHISTWSMAPSRWLAVGNLPKDINKEELEGVLSIFGDIRLILADRLHDEGVAYVAYYNILHAIRAHRSLQAKLIGGRYPLTEQNVAASGTVAVTYTSRPRTLKWLEDKLRRFGPCRPWRVLGSGDNKIIFEYVDIRSAARAKNFFDRQYYDVKVNYYDASVDSWSAVETVKNPGATDASQQKKPPNTTVRLSGNRAIPVKNAIDLSAIEDGTDTRTTLMIRNIPNKYTQEMFLEWLDETHFGCYDFVYLRFDFINKCNVGYAFVNFIEPKMIISFAKARIGNKWSRFNSEKICNLSYASIQGSQALIEKFRNSSVLDEKPEYRPKLFYTFGPMRGKEAPFPAPNNLSKRVYSRVSLDKSVITVYRRVERT